MPMFDPENGTSDCGVSAELLVGNRLRALRISHKHSLRSLAALSSLSINTLSLIENGKVSPSVSTLQTLARALDVPITSFFESAPNQKQVVFTPCGSRPRAGFGGMIIEHLGLDGTSQSLQPFIVRLEGGAGSGAQQIVHTGYEFVHCLSGQIHYEVDQKTYPLCAGDSLLFEAHLPHCWENQSAETAEMLLFMCAADAHEDTEARHFLVDTFKKEISMKIALITDDGKAISQHFGRAAYYLVLTIEDGKITNREMRDKMGHSHFAAQHEETAHGTAGHGMDGESHNKHVSMAETIADCKAVICGGMGMGAYESMRRLNIQPIVTDMRDVELAAQAFIAGKLIDHTEMLH